MSHLASSGVTPDGGVATATDCGTTGRRGWRSHIAIAGVVMVMAMIVAWGLYLRLSLLRMESWWMDELWTLDAISRSYKEMVGARLIVDNAPPLWTSTSWLWLRIVGTYDQGALRSLPMIFSVVAIAAPLAGAIRMRTLRPTFLVMAALFALSMLPIQYAAEMRSYSMLMALGSIATVVWAGLLTGALPPSGRWIFGFAFAGALAGFAHYYGNLLYASELGLLLLVWLVKRLPRRPLLVLLGWCVLSLVPVISFFLVAYRRGCLRSCGAVAGPPSWTEVRTWTGYAFAPLSNVLGHEAPGYAVGAQGYGNKILAVVAAALLVVVAFRLVLRLRHESGADAQGAVALVGACAMAVVAAGVALAWGVSVLLPPSMNVRNLAALVPALFLATAAAFTLPSKEPIRWMTGVVFVAVWAWGSVTYVAQYGVDTLGPPWQQNSGYRGTVQALITASRETPAPTLMGLKQPWDWHGDYDSAIRSALGSPPALPSDPPPLDVHWVLGPEDIAAAKVPDGPLVVFGWTGDPRGTGVFEWAQKTHGPCKVTTYGNGGYGNIDVARCTDGNEDAKGR